MISPQGYSITQDPKNSNPFWDKPGRKVYPVSVTYGTNGVLPDGNVGSTSSATGVSWIRLDFDELLEDRSFFIDAIIPGKHSSTQDEKAIVSGFVDANFGGFGVTSGYGEAVIFKKGSIKESSGAGSHSIAYGPAYSGSTYAYFTSNYFLKVSFNVEGSSVYITASGPINPSHGVLSYTYFNITDISSWKVTFI